MFFHFLFFSLWSFLIATAIRSSQLSACLMKHHYIITGILGRVSGKPASQLFLIARHTHNWAFYQVVQRIPLSCNITNDFILFSQCMNFGFGVSHSADPALNRNEYHCIFDYGQQRAILMHVHTISHFFINVFTINLFSMHVQDEINYCVAI